MRRPEVRGSHPVELRAHPDGPRKHSTATYVGGNADFVSGLATAAMFVIVTIVAFQASAPFRWRMSVAKWLRRQRQSTMSEKETKAGFVEPMLLLPIPGNFK
jgi:hypothetical protein